MNIHIVICILLVALVVGCNSKSDGTSSEEDSASSKVVKLFGGSDAFAAVKHAENVNVFRLKDEMDVISIDKLQIASGPVKLPSSSVAELRRTLLDQSTYVWDEAKGCEPIYGVRVQFVQGKDTVDVLFCFDCDILMVFHNETSIGYEDFDNGRTHFVAIMKQAFPNDASIQALK